MQKIVVVGIVVALVIVGIFAGVLPGLSILGDEGFETQSKWVHGIYVGNPDSEMLVSITDANRKGFITSYIDASQGVAGDSETIVVAGNYKVEFGLAVINAYKYVVKVKDSLYGSWHIVSEPGHTENWISKENPGKLDPVMGTGGSMRHCEPYVFAIRGPKEGGIRVELWGYFDPNGINPFDTWEWKLMSSDQAMLVSGISGMWLPPRPEGGYQSTFEIGETVKIDVETGIGAPDLDVDARAGQKTWKLELKKPDGTSYTGQNFPRMLQDHFQGQVTFTINSDMFTLGGNNRYTLRLFNTLLEKGSLQISTIDIRAKRPNTPTITPECGLSVQVPATIRVDLTATCNTETQLPITSFGVMVWYGMGTDLAPGSWGDDRWILRETFVTASNNKATFTIDVSSPNRYFTIIAYAHDSDGRDSDTEYYQIKTYAEDEPDEEDLIEEGGGQESYGGGTTGETTPADYYEAEVIDYTALIIAIIVFFAFLFVGLLAPLPYGIYGKILVIIIGAVLAVVIYFLLRGAIL